MYQKCESRAITDNKTLPPTGTGTANIVVATDEIAGVDFQKIKIVDGTADGTTPAKVDASGRQEVRVSAPTGTLSNVSGSATSVTLLASNAARVGATIWNDSTAILYVKFGATASATSCTVKLIADAYFEVPGGYTGIIDGIWASATGSARVTELT